jgi:hypothetical protein
MFRFSQQALAAGAKTMRSYATKNSSKVLTESNLFASTAEQRQIARMREMVANSGELNGTGISVYDLSETALKSWCEKIEINNRFHYNSAMSFSSKGW